VPAIVVEGLRKAYGPVDAVRGVHLTVEAGELLALLGPNGAGKTTTVEILEGHRRRSSGTVNVLGYDPESGGRRYRERIGIVLQAAGVDRDLTVRESVALFASYYPDPLRPDDVLRRVDLADVGRRSVKRLSGGQRRRLDLALGIVGRPEVLFLDEPTTGFDPAARRAAWRLIEEVRADGTTVLLTTHYMEEAHALADRVAIIAEGRIVAEGPPDALVADEVTEIRFRRPKETTVFDLPALVHTAAEVVLADGEVVLRTVHPTRVLHALSDWALSGTGELEGLSVHKPRLEDVYLRLTGGDG
jgi:ABC-2 type transport system ATP-binding protein